MNMDINFIVTILIQVTCIFIFLTVFYFTYASHEEEIIMEKQVNYLIDDLVGSNLNFLPESAKKDIIDKVNSIEPSSSDSIERNNDVVKKNAIITVSVVTGIVFLIVAALSSIHDVDIKKIFIEVAVIMVFVALTEFCFLHFFASNWISVDTSSIKAHIFKNLSDAFKNGSS